MKSLVLAAAAVAAISSSAFAGGPTVVADDPMPDAMAAPAAAHDWSGPYVGLSYGQLSGDLTYSTGAAYQLDSGSTPGLFAGYLLQRGAMVYGGELAYSRGQNVSVVGFPAENLEEIIDLKGRLGISSDRALFYAVLGYSRVGYLWGVNGSQNTAGYNYGLGFDLALSDRFTIGLEYLTRKTDGNATTVTPVLSRDLDMNSVAVRVGLSF